MKKLISFCAFLALLLFSSSCVPTSDYDGDLLFGVDRPLPNNETPVNLTSGKIIKKFSGTDKSGNPYEITYTYTDKKLSRVNYGNTQVFDLSYSNDSVKKIVATTTIAGTISTTNYNLVYNGNQLKQIDEEEELASGTVENATSVVTYNNSGKVTKVRRTTYSNENIPVEINYILFDFEYNGNNVSKFTSTSGSPLLENPQNINSISYSNFDSKNNPFNSLPKGFNIATLSTFNASLASNGFSVNNPGKVTIGAETAVLNYTYNKDNYPVSAKVGNETSIYEYQ